ncbi:MAG: hypothetical protein CVU08_09655 [Bacteroidetes bacterium HGW-Bacteroidetes-3]|jgi:hypothetical protein|nr:MAG: hypothetical protein CVU08_09655 [Bacteroidetes bacterium HGW-Bacteroidetes-3]
MKHLLTLLALLISLSIYAQQETEIGRYKLRMKKSSQDTVYMKIGETKTILKKGWTITESKGGVTVQRILLKDTVITNKKDVPVRVTVNWKIGEVKHSDDSPDKLYLNPYHFISPQDSTLNNKSYLKIPDNGYVTLERSYVKWNAITIPFAIRLALNDTIGSKITTDLKIGASFSYNVNWETFKNRRLKAKKTVKGISGGIGFGFSKVILNSSSTSLLNTPYKNEEDGLAFFVAPGIGLNLKGFQINFSYGWDFPITDNTNDWNYANKGYFGIGLGVGLDVFGK